MNIHDYGTWYQLTISGISTDRFIYMKTTWFKTKPTQDDLQYLIHNIPVNPSVNINKYHNGYLVWP